MSGWPNARDCEHGRLRRSCERCEDAAEIARLKTALRALADNTWNIGRRPALRYDEFARAALGEQEA